MAAHDLSLGPNLEQLRKRAKNLLRAARAEDPEALRRLHEGRMGHTMRMQLADALAVVAYEAGFPNWMKLKTYVESMASASAPTTTPPSTEQASRTPARQFGQRTRGRGPKKTPGLKYIQTLHAAVVEAAKVGQSFPFIFAPPLGPLTSAVQGPLREALVASGNLQLVVDVLLRGAQDPNAKVRAECAHSMDRLADERCLQPLLTLANDPVPRVRWFAIHSLACEDCKLTPLPSCPEVAPLIASLAATDPSPRVRLQAEAARRLMRGSGGSELGL
jgi:hypothetical protein